MDVDYIQRLATRKVKGMKDLSSAERLSALGLQTLEDHRFRGDLIVAFQCIKAGMTFHLRNSSASPLCPISADIPWNKKEVNSTWTGVDQHLPLGLWQHGTGFLSTWSMSHLSLLLSRDSTGAGQLFSVFNSCHLAYKCCISAYCAFMLPVYQFLVHAFPLDSSHYYPLHLSSHMN